MDNVFKEFLDTNPDVDAFFRSYVSYYNRCLERKIVPVSIREFLDTMYIYSYISLSDDEN
jgi:CRISPR/Cas system endoribonuclease Cas6 (RAMP superfamily)